MQYKCYESSGYLKLPKYIPFIFKNFLFQIRLSFQSSIKLFKIYVIWPMYYSFYFTVGELVVR